VQDDWVTILRFDSDAHLEAWLKPEQRKQILRHCMGLMSLPISAACALCKISICLATRCTATRTPCALKATVRGVRYALRFASKP
jgi:hypothetical protein